MAKKTMNHKRRMRALEKGQVAKGRNLVALALRLRGGSGDNHGDGRKAASRNACRGNVAY